MCLFKVPETVTKYCNFPICLMGGSDNTIFKPENLDRTYALLRKAHPEQDYKRCKLDNTHYILCVTVPDRGFSSL